MDPAKNFGFVTVSIGYDASATSIALSAGHGAKLPAPAVDGSFNLVWYDSTNYPNPADDPNVEICRVTARSTDTLTVTRAAESTTASTKNTASATYKMFLGVTAKTITDISLIKLDDFGTPDDNTDLDFGVLRHGLTPKGTNLGNYLKDDGTWASPSGSGDMTKAVYDTNDNSRVDTSETLYDAAGNKTYTQISSEIDGDITTHAALPNAHHNESHTVASHSDTTVTGPELDADHTKLATIDTSANAYTHPNHTGEVTSTGDGATVITDDAVTNAKLANVATDTIKGRTTGGTGDPEDLTAAQTRTILNVEDGSTADQTGAEIKTLYEAEANAFTDAKNTKLTGIEELADVTDSTNVAAAGAMMDSDVSDAEGFIRKTGVGAYDALKSNLTAIIAPTANDDSGDGYKVCSIWVDITADKAYICLDNTLAAAVWTEITQSGGGGAVDSVFTRTGAVVAAINDYTWAQIDKTTSDIADITTKSHTSLTDIGSNAHSVIDTHLGAANPHSGSAASGANSDITQLSGLTTDLSIAQGGTGQSTAQAAIDALSAVAGATDEHVLTKDTGTGNAIFKPAASGFADPMTTRGDIIVRNASNNTARLGIGSNTQVLKSDGTDIAWGAAGGAPVDSVFGRIGVVDASINDYTWAQIDKTTSDIANITTKSHTSLTDIGTTTHADLDTDHTKLATIDVSANNYTHPNHSGDVISVGDGVTAIAAGVIVNADVSSNAGIEMTKIAVSVIGSPIYDDAQDFMNLKSAGIITGGTITDSGSGQIDIAAGTGIIKIADSAMAETKSFGWDASLNFSLTDGQVNYIYINYNAGSPAVAVTTDRSTIETYRQFTLGRVFRNGNALHIINSGAQITNHDRGTHERLVMRGVQWGEGAVVSFTNKQLSSTAGKLYLGNNQLSISATLISENITQWYHTAGVWDSSLNTDIDNTYYDNGTNLTELGNSKYGVHWIYVCGCGGDLKSVYGTGSYSLSEAENASVPSTIPDCVDKLAILAAKVIILKGAASILSIASAYETNFPVSSPANHNDLGGIQGGAADDYYHLTNAQHTDLTDGNACTSHKHAATQIADGTVSDAEFQYINSLTSNAQTQIDARVTKALFDANTILKADSNDTPAALTVAEQTIVGRITAGVTTALTPAQVRTLINVEDGSTADQTGAEIKTLYEAEANAFTDTKNTKLNGIEEVADVTDAVNVASSIHGVAGKTTPVDADELGLIDSAATNVLKKLTWSNVKATLKTYFDTQYNNYVHPNHTGEVTSTGDGATVIVDDAVTYAKMQNVVADERILGNVTAADSVVAELTKAQVLTMLNVADGADVTGSNAPQAHDLDSHNACTLAELSTDISDDSVVGLAVAQTLTNKSIELDDALSGDHTYEGITIDDIVCENVAFGDILYMKSDGKWWKGSSAVASSAEAPIEAMAVATILADAAGKILLMGTVYDATFNFTTLGKVYAGVDVPTHTIPTTSGHTVQIIGTSLDANRMIFKPDSTYIELS